MGLRYMSRAVPSVSGGPQAFNFFIALPGSGGNDANDGLSPTVSGGHGPWAPTSMHSTSLNWNLMTGKRVGFVGGTKASPVTWDLGANGLNLSLENACLMRVKAGSAGNQTYYAPCDTNGSYQRLGVVLSMAGETSFPGGGYVGAMIGDGLNGVATGTANYVTLDGFEIVGWGTSVSPQFNAGGGGCNGIGYFVPNPFSALGLGMQVNNCRIHECTQLPNVLNGINAPGNGGGAIITNTNGLVFHNCHFYNNYLLGTGLARSAHTNAAGVYDWAQGTIFEYCTFHDSPSAIYQKNRGNPPPQGATVQYCYFYYGSNGSSAAIDGFNNATGPAPPYNATIIKGCIFEDIGMYFSNAQSAIGLLFTADLAAGAASGTLASAWTGVTGNYVVIFSENPYTGTTEPRTVALTNGLTTATITPALTKACFGSTAPHTPSHWMNGFNASVTFNNNLVVQTGAVANVPNGMQFIPTSLAANNGAVASVHDNLFVRAAGHSDTRWGDLSYQLNLQGLSASDFNGVPTDAKVGLSLAEALYPAQTGGVIDSWATWLTFSGKDVNSQQGSPTFTGGAPVAGGGTTQYQLTGGSFGKGIGTGGADMGPFALTSQIGCDTTVF